MTGVQQLQISSATLLYIFKMILAFSGIKFDTNLLECANSLHISKPLSSNMALVARLQLWGCYKSVKQQSARLSLKLPYL